MSDQTTFKGLTNYFDSQFSDNLAHNISQFFNWALLEAGAFYNVNMGNSGVYGGDPSRLRAVSDPNYIDGQVWEGYRSNWIYESGLAYQYQPIKISGVYVNSTFQPNNSGVSINYPLGRVIFDSAISTNSVVKTEYSFKYVNVSTADTPWFRKFQTDSLRIDNQQFLLQGSGIWNVFGQSRVQLPALVIQPLTRVSFEGLQIGGGQIRYQDIMVHVLSETPWDRNTLSDTLLNQRNKTLFLYDVNKAGASGILPIDLDGKIVSGGFRYPDLVQPDNGYLNYRMFFYETSADEVENTIPLYYSVVRMTTRTQIDNI